MMNLAELGPGSSVRPMKLEVVGSVMAKVGSGPHVSGGQTQIRMVNVEWE
jgi:hypothetical protein